MSRLVKIKTALSGAIVAGLCCALSTPSLAASTAIVNATLYTGADNNQPQIIEGGSIRFEDGIITAVSTQALQADTIIDAQGKIVTPGLIGSMNHLGVMEVNAVLEANDSTVEEPDLSFTPVKAFNPESAAIALARNGGITRNIIIPEPGKAPFSGIAGAVDLAGKLALADTTPKASVVYLWGDQESSRAWKLEKIIEALQKRIDEAQKPPKEDEDEAIPSVAEQRLDQLLAKKMPLLVFCHRPSDILRLIQLKETYDIDLIIAGGDGAVAVKEQLADADVAVVIDALNNLPESFDSLHASLDNAAKLHNAGVKVALAVLSDATHGLYQLRFGAGNAIANALPPGAALASITSVPAELFGLNSGLLAQGRAADVVIWEHDPFDFTGQVHSLWIDGQMQSLNTRADQLRQRYTTPSDLPPAYTQ